MRVAVLRGGRSSEHQISLRSAAAVADGMRAAGHEVVEVLIEPDGRWIGPEGKEVDLNPGRGLLGADVAFGVLHGPNGEDGSVQGAFEVLDLPYVGSGVLAAAVTIDKLTCKRLLAHQGIPQVGFVEPDGEDWSERALALGLPLWVKPSRLGSSVGICRVDEAAQLEAAVIEARTHDSRVIIEAHCEGREVEVSILGNAEPTVSIPGEIIARADWYDFEAKYSEGGMELVVPAPIGEAATAELRRLAALVFRSLGCSGLARCDFFVTEAGRVLVNEINTIPGFTETSVFAKLFEADGLTYPELCDRLVELALERYESERSHTY